MKNWKSGYCHKPFREKSTFINILKFFITSKVKEVAMGTTTWNRKILDTHILFLEDILQETLYKKQRFKF